MNRRILAWHCGWMMALLANAIPAHATGEHASHLHGQTASAPQNAQSAQASSVSAPNADAVVATVNGQPITRSDLDELIRARTSASIAHNDGSLQGARSGDQALAGVDGKQLLDELVAMEVLSQQARARGIHLRPAVAAEAALQYKTLLTQQLVRELVAEIEVDPTDVVKRFAEQRPEQIVQVSHILLKDESDARVAIAEIDKGADFGKVARRRSLDPQSKNDGNLGWVMLSQMEAPFAAAASTLKAGEYTRKPVGTSSGWHVIRVNATREPQRPSLEDTWDTLRMQVLQDKVQARVRQLMQEARIEVPTAK